MREKEKENKRERDRDLSERFLKVYNKEIRLRIISIFAFLYTSHPDQRSS